jgi:hypothetical protein
MCRSGEKWGERLPPLPRFSRQFAKHFGCLTRGRRVRETHSAGDFQYIGDAAKVVCDDAPAERDGHQKIA